MGVRGVDCRGMPLYLESAHGEHYRRTQTTYASLRDLYADTGRPREAKLFAAKLSP
jgi:hypothetical protein